MTTVDEARAALRNAAVYVLQLADKDISPLLGESLMRALEQDGYTVSAIRAEYAEAKLAALQEAVVAALDGAHIEYHDQWAVWTLYLYELDALRAALAATPAEDTR